jgi:hypothetical protein
MNKGFWVDGGGWGTTGKPLSFPIHHHHPEKQSFLYKIFMIFHNRRGILDSRGVIGQGHAHHLGEVT